MARSKECFYAECRKKALQAECRGTKEAAVRWRSLFEAVAVTLDGSTYSAKS